MKLSINPLTHRTILIVEHAENPFRDIRRPRRVTLLAYRTDT